MGYLYKINNLSNFKKDMNGKMMIKIKEFYKWFVD